MIAPTTYAAVVGRRHRGFTRQPCLVLSRDPALFRSRLADAGGPAAVRNGVLVDLPFAALLCGATGVIVAAADGPWWLVLPAAALDVLEGLALWVIAGKPEPTRRAVHLLFGIAVAKFVAYGASLIALVWAARTML